MGTFPPPPRFSSQTVSKVEIDAMLWPEIPYANEETLDFVTVLVPVVCLPQIMVKQTVTPCSPDDARSRPAASYYVEE